MMPRPPSYHLPPAPYLPPPPLPPTPYPHLSLLAFSHHSVPPITGLAIVRTVRQSGACHAWVCHTVQATSG